jgi:hypothetical protein
MLYENTGKFLWDLDPRALVVVFYWHFLPPLLPLRAGGDFLKAPPCSQGEPVPISREVGVGK